MESLIQLKAGSLIKDEEDLLLKLKRLECLRFHAKSLREREFLLKEIKEVKTLLENSNAN